jgi:DNA-binding response OmpR family regulator
MPKQQPKQKILIVDDNELVLTMARDFLEEAGFDVVTASDGVQANNYIFSKKRKPDLMIFDVMLPSMNGDQKVKLLRGKDMGKQIPMLLISAKDEAELTQLAAQAGADGFILKPFTQEGIVASVRNTLSAALASHH